MEKLFSYFGLHIHSLSLNVHSFFRISQNNIPSAHALLTVQPNLHMEYKERQDSEVSILNIQNKKHVQFDVLHSMIWNHLLDEVRKRSN